MSMYHSAGGRPSVGLGLGMGSVGGGRQSEWEGLIKTLQDSSQRDDLKLKALQEIWAGFDVFCNSPTYSQILDSLFKSFLKLFTETAPQFIMENNTQQLRKLMLEIILRTSSHEISKQFTKQIQTQMVKLIQNENEENGCLALKILIDHMKSYRVQFGQEVSQVTSVLQHFRAVFRSMHEHINNVRMFEPRKKQRPPHPMKEEALIETYLHNCFYSQKVVLIDSSQLAPGQDEPEYVLIPRASQSVKMLAEVPMFFVLIHNSFKNAISAEVNEMTKVVVSFLNLVVPSPPPRDPTDGGQQPNFNRELADECFNCQMKCLSFLAFIAKQSAESHSVFSNTPVLISGILNLLETCPPEMVQARRELLMAVKFFYNSDIRSKFLQYVPRLFSERLMVGTGYTCQDTIRPVMYSINADLLHHLRLQLSYPILCHTIFVYSRGVHDVLLPPNMQSMCIRLMMNLCEAFVKMDTANGDACRDFLFHILESGCQKMKIIAYYHLPLLFKQHGNGMEWKPMDGGGTCRERSEDSSGSSPSSESKDPLLEELAAATEANEAKSRRGSIDTIAEFEGADEHDANTVLKARRTPSMDPPTRDSKKFSSVETMLTSVWAIPAPPLSLVDCRNMIKFLLQMSKFVVQHLVEGKCKRTNKSISYGEEREVFVRLLKYGLMCLDVFMLPASSQNMQSGRQGGVRSREEKDSLECFAGMFTLLNTDVFLEIFSAHMDFLIERISRNYALQLICNSFLVNPDTSAKFGGILVNYLLQRLPHMSVNSHRSNLYLKLYKLMFSAVSCAQSTGCADIERMLKPYMHDMVSDAVRLALNSREPQNYFLLLRALFRSIGGGAHDMLYAQFLPLLPDLLKKLNRLQSCAHRQHMRELFTELCLTIPVRLSSLLPYLPLLMDPLVSALSGSSALMQQGLRTLELCVDNLQPEYLYEHMAPVRAALMQGLWRTVATAAEYQSAQTAMRILGKLGGSNRKMLVEPQKLRVQEDWQLEPVLVSVEVVRRGGGERDVLADAFPEESQPLYAQLGIGEAMRVAVEQLRQTSLSDPSATLPGVAPQPQPPTTAQIRQNAAGLARAVILSGLSPVTANEWSEDVIENVKKELDKLSTLETMHPIYKCRKEGARQTYMNALTALFFAIVGKDLRNDYVKFFNVVVKQLTIQSLLEQVGYSSLSLDDMSLYCMDASVLIDALVVALSDLNKEFTNAVVVALHHIIGTLKAVVDDESTMVRLPFLNHLVERICELCYGPSWFARLGGASGVKYMVVHYPPLLIKKNLSTILTSLLEVQVGLLDEVSSGALDISSAALELLPKTCFPSFNPTDEDDLRALSVFVDCYSRYIFTPDKAVRTQVYLLFQSLSTHTSLPISQMLETKQEQLTEQMMKAIARFGSDSMHAQASTMDAFNLLLGGEKAVIKLDKSDPVVVAFAVHVCSLCEQTEATLVENVLYRPLGPATHHPHDLVQRMVPLRQAAAECIVACYVWLTRAPTPPLKERSIGDENMECEDSGQEEEKEGVEDDKMEQESDIAVTDELPAAKEILHTALRLLGDKQEKIQMTTREALMKAIALGPLPADIIQESMEKVLVLLDERVTDAGVRQLLHMVLIDKGVIEERCEKIVKKQLLLWDEESTQKDDSTAQPIERGADDLQAFNTVCHLLGESPRFGADIIPNVCSFLAKVDYEYCVNRPLSWERTVLRFLCRLPMETIRFFIAKESVASPARRALFRRLIKYPEASALRRCLTENDEVFLNLLQGKMIVSTEPTCSEWLDPVTDASDQLRSDGELLVLNLIDQCSRADQEWFANAKGLMEQMREVWKSDDFKLRHVVKSLPLETSGKEDKINVQMLHMTKYKVPKLMVTCMLRYLRSNYEDMDLLFDVLTVFIGNYVTDFTFVRQYLENEVIPVYPVEWRRQAFFKVMDKFLYSPEETTMDLGVVKVIQYLLIPCLQYALERYDVDLVVGPPCLSAPPVEKDGKEGETEEERMNKNIVVRLEKVIEHCRKSLSDRMMVVFYQLATLFVQHAPQHIHDNSSKKQGLRLRTYMLLAWPCLNQPTQDVTIKYSAHLFLAHIVEKFTINRKIVLQVYHSLMSAYATDNRDVVKKAFDIITPAVPVRMDDGYYQLLTAVKKVLAEETHNTTHTYHCIYMICRNYRVYYHVRHEMLPCLLGALTKLNINGSYPENRRLALEVCEMVIKWDLLRNQKMAQTTDKEGDDEIEGVLEKLKGNVDREKESAGDETKTEGAETGPVSPQGTPQDGSSSRKEKDLINMPIQKEHAEYVVGMLMKLATHPPHSQQAQNQQQILIELSKRSVALLKAALKPVVWGETVNIKVNWLEKQLSMPTEPFRQEQGFSHLQQATHTLEVLGTLVQTMPPSLSVQTIRPLQNAIISCLTCGHNLVVRAVNALVGALLKKTKSSAHGLMEFDVLNKYINKFLTDQFGNYEKNPGANTQLVFTAFSLLRNIGLQQSGYIEAMLGQNLYLKVLQKLTREHVHYVTQKPEAKEKAGIPDLIAVALELIRPVIGKMTYDFRKLLTQNVLVYLIEKTDQDKVVDASMKMVHELVVSHNDDNAPNPGLPVLVRMMSVLERKYKTHSDLMRSYLNTLLFVFEKPNLRRTDFATKLHDSFYWGLYFTDESIRNKFLRVWENDLEPSVMTRLQYIFSQHDWTPMKDQFWIKHAVYLLLKCVKEKADDGGKRIRTDRVNCPTFWRTYRETAKLQGSSSQVHSDLVDGVHTMHVDEEMRGPKVEVREIDGDTSIISVPLPQATPIERPAEPISLTSGEIKEEDGPPLVPHPLPPPPPSTTVRSTRDIVLEETRGLLHEAANYDMAEAINSFCALVFSVADWQFISSAFSELFTSIWSKLSNREQASLENILMPFLSSGIHIVQSSSPHSVVAVLLDTFNRCTPPIRFDPTLVKYASVRHRSWHRGLLILEDMALRATPMLSTPTMQFLRTQDMPNHTQQNLEVLDTLYELYSELGELDQFSVVWEKRAFSTQTNHALTLLAKGETEEACNYLENVMHNQEDQLIPMTPAEVHSQFTSQWNREQEFWMKMWTDCTRELSRWTTLRDYANSNSVQDLPMLMRIAPHMPDWVMLRECKEQIAGCVPPSFLLQYTLHCAMLAVMDPEPSTTEKPQAPADKLCDETARILIDQWRSLPTVIDQAHVGVLQAMNSLQETVEASLVMGSISTAQIQAALQQSGTSGQPATLNHNVLHDMKNVIKTWRNRGGASSDPLSVIISFHHWRLVIHSSLVSSFDLWEKKGVRVDVALIPPAPTSIIPSSFISQQLVPIHSSAQGQLAIAQAARLHRHYDFAQESLDRLHTLQTLPTVDTQTKIIEHIKLCRTIADDRKVDGTRAREALLEALDICQTAPVSDFNREHLYKLFAQKGNVLSKLDRKDDAERAFSAAAQLQDGLNSPVGGANGGAYKAWAYHLDAIFHQNRNTVTAGFHGLNAVASYLEATRCENEMKASKCIARLLWTAKCVASCGGEQTRESMDETIRRHAPLIVPANWLQWLSSLVLEIRHRATSGFASILSKIAATHPQQVFYAIRSELPKEIVDRVAEKVCTVGSSPTICSASLFSDLQLTDWQKKLVDILDVALSMRPSGVRSLNRILGDISEMREYWVERQLRSASDLLDRVFRVLAAHRETGVQFAICGEEVAECAQRWKMLLEDPSQSYLPESSAEWTAGSDRLDSEEKYRTEQTLSILSFLETVSASEPLRPLLTKLIPLKIDLSKRIGKLPKSILLSFLSPYLADFSSRTADVEMFTELFSTRAIQYQSMITRFGARVYVELRGGRVLRRLEIRAHTGKQTTYLVRRGIDEITVGRVPQFTRHFNMLMQKEVETCRRFLRSYCPTRVQCGSHSIMLEVPSEHTTLLHPIDVMAEKIRENFLVPDEIASFFYEAIAQPEDLREIPNCMASAYRIYSEWCPPWLLHKYISERITDPTHFYTLRKQIAQQLGVLAVLEMSLNLSPLRLEDMIMCIGTSQLCHGWAQLEIGSTPPPPIPFRFTPNLQSFVGISRDGHMKWAMVATAKCLRQKSVLPLMRTLLWDEVTVRDTSDIERTEQLTRRIESTVERLTSPNAEKLKEDVYSALLNAQEEEYLCKADASWHPWF